MNYSKDRIIYLLDRLGASTASPEELAEIDSISERLDEDEQLRQEVTAVFAELEPVYPGDAIRNRILERVFAVEYVSDKGETGSGRTIQLWKRIAVAASIIGVLFVAGYWLMKDKPTDDGPQTTVVQTDDVQAPDKNRAQIKLSDGTVVYLDSAANGELANMNGVVVKKTEDGKIVYEAADGSSTALTVYNTLSNPRGSKVIDMTLADGSHVWLNAGSSVTYPVAFVGNERKVEITGEAYFEVNGQRSTVDGKKIPFVVSKGDVSVTVLGTHFNVNAYDDESDIKVTLLEGSVRVRNEISPAGRNDVMLKPGQQAQVATIIKVENDVNTEQVMAWRNGRFQFDKASLQEVMRQIARWYNVEVVYEANIPLQQFGGKMQRDLNLSEVLDGLKKSEVHFRIEGNKVIVTR